MNGYAKASMFPHRSMSVRIDCPCFAWLIILFLAETTDKKCTRQIPRPQIQVLGFRERGEGWGLEALRVQTRGSRLGFDDALALWGSSTGLDVGP